MRNLNLALLLSALLFPGIAPGFAAPAPEKAPLVYDLLADLVTLPAAEVSVSTPAAGADKYEKPPCVPSAALAPGRAFVPVVSDARRVRAINELLGKISVCTPLPYDNDGVVHTDPHNGLPRRPAGYYKEYTLIVPGRNTGDRPEPVVIGGSTYMTGPVLSHRGPERLMIGDGREVYYTPDHYSTFVYLSIVR